MFDLVVRNGQVVTPERIYKASVCVKDGKIAALISPEDEIVASKFIDADGKYVFPGAKNATFALATLGNDAGMYGGACAIMND